MLRFATPRLSSASRRSAGLALSVALMASLLPAGPASAEVPVPPDVDEVCTNGLDGFPDVGRGNVHYDAINCIAELGIARGYVDGTYGPDHSVSREQMASFLANMVEQVRELPQGTTSFDDVSGGVHGDNISKLADAGITRGVDASNFDPRGDVSRGQLASFVNRALAYVATGDANEDILESGPGFPDVGANSTHGAAISALAGAGIVSGYTDGTFGPDDDVRRDQMATFLMGGLEVAIDLAPPMAQLLADVDRDGFITSADAAGRADWTEERGAIMLANLDDHAEECGEIWDEDGAPIHDDDLALCFDANDEVINGSEDIDDLAPFEISPINNLSDDAEGTLTFEPAEYANVFVGNGSDWSLIESGETFDATQLADGVELRIEATDIVRDAEVWDGFVDLSLEIAESTGTVDSDALTFRVAPVLFVNNTMPLERLIIASHEPQPEEPQSFGTFSLPSLDGETGQERDILGDDMVDGVTAGTFAESLAEDPEGPDDSREQQLRDEYDIPEYWPNGYADFRFSLRDGLDALGHTEDFIEFNTTDKWVQDMFEPGYMSMPAAGGGEHRMRLYIRTPNQSRSGFREGRPLREGGRALYEQLQGPGTGIVQQYDSSLWPDTEDGRHPHDTFNSGGNFEAAPPFVDPDGREFPAGRMIYGARPPFAADESFLTMLDAQGYQDPIRIDTSFLRVGHTDEFLTFLPVDNERGWIMGVADAALGTTLLEQMVEDGHGDEVLVNDVEELGGRVALGDLTIDEARFHPELRLGQLQAEAGIEKAVALIKEEIGLSEDDIVRLPALFRDPGTTTGGGTRTGLYAYLPGVANGISTGTGGFLSPKQHGPQVDGVDVFQEYTEAALGEHDIDVEWVEDWVYAHQGTGEIHCVTNAQRDLTVTEPWWGQTDARTLG